MNLGETMLLYSVLLDILALTLITIGVVFRKSNYGVSSPSHTLHFIVIALKLFSDIVIKPCNNIDLFILITLCTTIPLAFLSCFFWWYFPTNQRRSTPKIYVAILYGSYIYIVYLFISDDKFIPRVMLRFCLFLQMVEYLPQVRMVVKAKKIDLHVAAYLGILFLSRICYMVYVAYRYDNPIKMYAKFLLCINICTMAFILIFLLFSNVKMLPLVENKHANSPLVEECTEKNFLH
ncbi:unnamed protein product, partial [Diabrotica balteata]